MRATTTITTLLIFLFLGLTGCGTVWTTFGLPNLAVLEKDVTSQGARSVLLNAKDFEKIDLIAELYGVDCDKLETNHDKLETNHGKGGTESDKQRALSDEKRALSDEKRALSDEKRALSDKQRALSDKQRAVSDDGTLSDQEKALSDEKRALSDKQRDLSDKERALSDQERIKICGEKEKKNTKKTQEENTEENTEKNAKNLAKAFAFFNERTDKNTKRRRNAIQERILSASMQRCGEFKNFLRQLQTETDFFLGSAATTLGGLGAIFTPLSTVRALSGAAGIMSGIRAEFNESFFYNQMVHVITKGIDSRREDIYKKIRDEQEKDLEKYPIQAAVKDAIKFHESCSTIVGFQVAGDAIQQTRDPGLKQFQKVFKDLQGTTITINESGLTIKNSGEKNGE